MRSQLKTATRRTVLDPATCATTRNGPSRQENVLLNRVSGVVRAIVHPPLQRD